MDEYIELNLSNYDHDDVCQLNSWAIWAFGRIEELERATMTEKAPPVERLAAPRAGLYLVSRTSDDDGRQPCEEAYRMELMHVDRREHDDPKKVPAYEGTDGDWYEYGENHRIENGKICRDLGWCKEWVVEISDLMEFVDKHGDCVVGRNEEGFATIEIYDAWRPF